MKENLYGGIRISMNNPNDRKILVLLKYLDIRNRKEEKMYAQLLNIYPENEYYEEQIIEDLLLLKLMRKNIIQERKQTDSGYVGPAEFIPITNDYGRKAVEQFPSEYKKHQWELFRGWFGVIMSVVSTIIAIIAIIL